MTKLVRLLPFLFFIVSGACALVYEVVWGRYLSLFLGNTTHAHMCVLVAFMGGLALGSVILGRKTERITRPLYFYGWIEAVIGLYAIIFPFFINPLQSFILNTASGISLGSPIWIILKLAVSLVVLLAPTFLMGGTFPILMRHFQPESSESEDKTEWLYLANCAGAVGGTLLAGFLLIPALGLRGTLVDVGLVNTALGVTAIILGRGTVKRKKQVVETTDDVERSSLLRPIYAAVAISGAAAMIYELVWIRMFAITLGGSTYSFTLMLAAFISGIALGSLAVGLMPWARKKPLLWFAMAEMAIAFAVIAGIPLYERLPYMFWKWSLLLRPSEASFWLHSTFKYLLCFMVMVVPTFFSGMALPLAIKAASRRDDHIGKDAGYVYGANTAGTLIGALAAGLLFIPVIGLRSSLELAVLINVGAGFLLFYVSDISHRNLKALVLVILAALTLRFTPPWHPASFTYGLFRKITEAPKTWTGFRKFMDDSRVLFYGEDGSNTVAVMVSRTDPRPVPQMTLYTDGKAEASSVGDMPTQILIGQIPMFLKPDASQVLVIGLGSGVSAGSVLTHPYIEMDCVEISPVVVDAARHFEDVNRGVLDNPRMNLVIEDARTLLAVGRKKYDVVISEPTNPWVAGMGNLFSLEFFRSVERTLEPDGAIVQWFHTYEMSDELVKTTLRTMRKVFPYVYIFQASTSDAICVGSKKPLKPDFGLMEEKMQVGSVSADLGRINIDTVAALLSLQMLAPESVAKIAGKGVINSDNRPVLEYRAPKAQYAGAGTSVLSNADERLGKGSDLFSTRYLREHPLDRDTCRSLIRLLSARYTFNIRLYYSLMEYYVTHWPDDTDALREYAVLAARRDASNSLKAATTASDMNRNWRNLENLADVLLSRLFRANSVFTPQDYSPVVKLLEEALQKNPDQPTLRMKLEMLKKSDEWRVTAYPGLPYLGLQSER